MSESRLKTAITIIPVISAGLYLLGLSYHLGYIERFGIEDSLFTLPTEKSLFVGFLMFINFGFVSSMYALGAILALSIAVLVAALLSSSARVKRFHVKISDRWRIWRTKNEPAPEMNALLDATDTAYSYAAGSVVVTTMLIVVVPLSAMNGREQAAREIEAFKNQRGNWVMLHTSLLPAPTRAVQIICGDSHCAFWLGNESLILPHDAIKRIVGHYAALPRTQVR